MMMPAWRVRVLRIVDHAPTEFPTGQAAYIDFEWEKPAVAPGRTYRSLALVVTMPSYGQWTYYTSMVSAPTEQFAARLPTLMRIWGSYQISGQLVRERLERARTSIQEIDAIIDQTYAARQASEDRIAANWTAVIRDQTRVEDTRVGERYEVPLSAVDDLVRLLNDASGYARYRHIPLRDLQ
jgi:hypothetical protein